MPDTPPENALDAPEQLELLDVENHTRFIIGPVSGQSEAIVFYQACFWDDPEEMHGS